MTEVGGKGERISPLQEVGEYIAGGLHVYVFKGETNKGSYLYFSPTEKIIRHPERKGSDIARLRFRVQGNELVLGGMLVPKLYAGKNLGVEMLKYLNEWADKKGLDFFRTGTIQKPMIALALARAGFVPVSQDVLVEILPQSQSDESRIPNVLLINNAEKRAMVSGSDGGEDQFYRIISKAEALRKYPATTEEKTVAISTRYIKKSAVERAKEHQRNRKEAATE